MTNVEVRLQSIGLTLPSCPVPAAAYVVAQRAGNLIFVSGQTAYIDKSLMFAGKVGRDISIEDAYKSARICALRCISELREIANLDKLRIIKLTGYVNGIPEFEKQPMVVNGASELIEAAFLDNGKHARCAVGVGSLPDNASVEIELIAMEEE